MSIHVLDGYLSEFEMAKQRGLCVRTLRIERQKRVGPPYVRNGRFVFYSIESFREWLKAGEVRPVARGRLEARA